MMLAARIALVVIAAAIVDEAFVHPDSRHGRLGSPRERCRARPDRRRTSMRR